MGGKNRTAPEPAEGDDGGGAADAAADAGQDFGDRIQFDPHFDGPIKRRSCTDVICLVIFVAFLVVWGVVAFVGVRKGDINKVIFPTDSMGRVCGQGSLAGRPYLLFFDLTKCLNPGILARGCGTPQVCVKSCPSKAFSGYAMANSGGEEEAKLAMKPFCSTMLKGADWNRKTALSLIREGLCPAWVLPSRPVLGRCLPVGVGSASAESRMNVVDSHDTPDKAPIGAHQMTKAVTALGAFLKVRDFGERVANDLADTWWMIGLACLAATVLSFMWIVLMRFFAGLMVWLSIGLLLTVLGLALGYSVFRYIDLKNTPDAELTIIDVNFTPDYLDDVLGLRDTWLAFIIILSIVTIVILLLLIALRQRIQIAISLITQGSKAVAQMVSTLAFPIMPFALHLVVVAFSVLVAMFLASIGLPGYVIQFDAADDAVARIASANATETTPDCNPGRCVNPDTGLTYKLAESCHPNTFNGSDCGVGFCSQVVSCQFTSYQKAPVSTWMQWFNLFGFYWGMNFVAALSEMVLAGAFATWYWTWEKDKVPCFGSLGRSLWNAVIFHAGTVAFGSLIIAIIKFVRAIVSYVESKLKAYNNELVKCLMCLCKCCLWCLEKFMRFINRNAYIMCAIKSTNFCTSAKDAFNLLMRNLVRVVVLNKIVDFLLFLGQLVIMAGVGTMSYFVFSGSFPDLVSTIPTLNYFVTPVIAIVLGTYFITSSFFGVYSMAVDTLFLCFLEDLERNDGTPSRPYYMSKGLQKIVGKMQKFNDDQVQYRMEQQSKMK